MMKLLFISYLFPPVGGSGVQRSLKFAKYLPEFGWEPIMLVADSRWLKQPKDHSLVKEIPAGLTTYRFFAPDLRWLFKLLWGLRLNSVVRYLSRHILIPDPEIIFLPMAKLAIKRVFAEHKVDLVFITSPPFSALFLGEHISKKYGVDYCLSFRDLWTEGVSRLDNPLPKRWQAKETAWERSAIRSAKQVICVNEARTSKLSSKYPDIPSTKLHTITNGYDENDFRNQPEHHYQRAMHLVYTGSFYDRFQPDIIWQVLLELVETGSVDTHKVIVDIYGNNFEHFVFGKYINNKILRRIVHLHAYLPHSQSISAICQADVLLTYSGTGANADLESPGKLFEYMRSGRPILAVMAPDGISKTYLENSGTGFIADSSSVSSIKQQLFTLYRKWESQQLSITPNWDYIRQFERRQLTSKLASLLNTAIDI